MNFMIKGCLKWYRKKILLKPFFDSIEAIPLLLKLLSLGNISLISMTFNIKNIFTISYSESDDLTKELKIESLIWISL
jgi:hypothetical protein